MRKPNESLDDYIVKPAPEVTSPPPREVYLQRTGQVEKLQPLAPPEETMTVYTFRPRQPLWFRRVLLVGSGSLVMMAAVLVSAILIGISEAPPETDAARQDSTIDELLQIRQPLDLDIFSASSFAPMIENAESARPASRRKATRPRINFAAFKPRRQLRPVLQPEEPKFVPTTLIIYSDNGVIRSRVEPWIRAS